MSFRPTLVALCLTVLSLAVPSRRAAAQTQTLPPFFSSLSVNPLGIPLLIAELEYQGDMGAGVTLGGNLSYVAPPGTDKRWTTLEAEGRYYPGGTVFKGFNAGVTAGITSFSNIVGTTACNPGGGCTTNSSRQSASSATIGFTAEYNWLLGTQQRFLVGTGIGAKRLLGNGSELSHLGQDSAYPTARFVIGLLF